MCTSNILTLTILCISATTLAQQTVTDGTAQAPSKSGTACQSESSSSTVSLFGGMLTVPNDYNKNVKPPGDPAVVSIGFIVSDIMEVDDDEYTISMNVGLDGVDHWHCHEEKQ